MAKPFRKRTFKKTHGLSPTGPAAGPSQGAKRLGAKRYGSGGPLGPGVHIVHEDADIIIVDKPAGLNTVDMAHEGIDCLIDRLREYLMRTKRLKSPSARGHSRAASKGSNRERDDLAPQRAPMPGIIHRLDKEASGLLVFSLSDRAYQWLKDDFKHKRVHRLYTAVTQNVLGKPGETGIIQSFFREDERGRIISEENPPPTPPRPQPLQQHNKFTNRNHPSKPQHAQSQRPRDDDDEESKLAVTHYRVVDTKTAFSLVQLKLSTGRKNQIRVHLASKNCPIVGDTRYGSDKDPLNRILLHATELGFTHPGTGQDVRFVSPPPETFYRVIGLAPPLDATNSQTQEHPQNKAIRSKHSQPATDTSWNNVASWYDGMVDQKRNDHYSTTIIPGVLRLVQPTKGQRILDVACGQGVIARSMSDLGAYVFGVDAAPDLIKHAKSRGPGLSGGEFHVGDARGLDKLNLKPDFDAATCIMALTNFEPIDECVQAVANLLKPGGHFVFVISHPAFRAPGQTSWGWDKEALKQFRKVDGYLSVGQHRIQMHPGEKPDVVTWTFHRPIQYYVHQLFKAGLMIESLEEWISQRVSEPGSRAQEENRIRREIPLFLAVRAVKPR